MAAMLDDMNKKSLYNSNLLIVSSNMAALTSHATKHGGDDVTCKPRMLWFIVILTLKKLY
jgi:hypothetical protein